MVDCDKCLFVSVCKKRPTMPGAKIAECNTFRLKKESTKPQTNADCIRAMTDAELVNFIASITAKYGAITAAAFGKRLIAEEIQELEEYYREIWAVWVEQPVEEEE